jgi:uncharacterized protein YggE
MLKMNTALRTLALSLALAGAAAGASPVPDYPFVHVRGDAFVAMMPDIAALDFEIVAADTDPAAARAVLEARVAETRALMQQLGMDPGDAVVREVRQTLRKPEPGSGTAAATAAGTSAAAGPLYELRCDVKINVRNVANWPALAGGLFGKPNLDGFASTFDLSTMEQVNDELVTSAIGDARRRAEVIAAASGRRLGAVVGATPDAIKNLTNAMGLARDEFRTPRSSGNTRTQDVDREQLMMIRSLKLNQPMDVIFRLENPAPARAARR